MAKQNRTRDYAALVGQRFGRYVVLAVESGGRRRLWCLCDCGEIRFVRYESLRDGESKSCGCLHRELLAQRTRKHGMAESRTWNSWLTMKARCSNPNNTHFRYYGGRGIGYPPEWERFEAFLADMGERPLGMSLDRINTDADYSPDNCRWATHKQQMNNFSRNRREEMDGVVRTVAEWADHYGVKYQTVQSRMQRGRSLRRALTDPVVPRVSRKRTNAQHADLAVGGGGAAG